jgi:hypothetical protein
MLEDKEALKYLVELGDSRATQQIHEVNGVPFTGNDLKLTPIRMPMPEVLEMSTLTGLVDFITANRDELELDSMIVHIQGPHEVRLCGPLCHVTEQRPAYIISKPKLPTISLETYLMAEQFNLQLQYGFVDTQGRKDLLAFIGSIRQESSVDTEDDGVTQTVTAKAGIARVAEVPAPNPVYLRPYRTFPEVEQPECAFILRMKTGPCCGLWEGDGGAWRNTAMQSIKDYLRDKLPDMAILA